MDAIVKIFEGTAVVALCLMIIALIPFGAYSIIESSNIKDALYTECLTTDYDKFQCYSMIYGDK